MSYAQQLVLARVVAVVIVAVTAIMAGNADLLGITPRITAWLAIFVGVLGAVGGYLPNVLGTDRQPEHIANRISELKPSERVELRTLVEQRHQEEESAA